LKNRKKRIKVFRIHTGAEREREREREREIARPLMASRQKKLQYVQ